jgi:uncharacterized protein (TIGR03435 family)
MRFLPMHLLLAAALTAPILAQSPPQSSTPIQPMAPTADPSFEVATIRPAKPGDPHQHFSLNGHRVVVENQSVTALVCVAYTLHKSQLIGEPAWFDDRYDIEGVPDAPGEPSFPQIKIMLQKLLADRFALKLHHDQRDLSIFALTIAKGGPRLTRNTTGREGQPDEFATNNGTERTMKFSNFTMKDFSHEMQFGLDRAIVDQTGLPGRYNFELHYTTDEATTTDPDSPPGLFTAIQEQLGLKLVPQKGPADVLVIDRIARPSPN